ncbi:MAG: hypothetical protein KAI53_04645, partial [Candidatus Aenigmarchaeota archaeon]|nr:hypothetical protein [Candidatus Aenigmarchaeota archaeon]
IIYDIIKQEDKRQEYMIMLGVVFIVVVGFLLVEYILLGATIYELTSAITILILCAMLIGSSKSKHGEVLILWVLLLFFTALLAPMLNAWVPIAGNTAKNIDAQLGMGEKTEGIFSAISDGIADIWLMLTDPVKWSEKKDADKGKQEGGALALEITSVSAMPKTSMPNGEYSMMFEIKNLGENDATSVFVGARLDNRALIHGSYIIDGDDGGDKISWLYRSVDNVHPGEQRFESFDIVAPTCAGTFKTTAYVEYSYNAIAITNLEVINRDYYNDLLKHDKLQFKDQLSTSSAGPFKLTIRTQYPQPIPITKTDGTQNKFNIYFNAINEREGRAFIKDITFELPEGIIVPEESTDDCELEPVVEGGNLYSIKETIKDGKNMCVGPNDMTSLKCVFAYDEDVGGSFEQEKTLFLKTGIDYTFTYKKSTTTTVKSNVVGFDTCSEIENDENSASYETVLTAYENDLRTKNDAILNSECDLYEDEICTMNSPNQGTIINLVTQLETACNTIWGNYGDYILDGVSQQCASVTLSVDGVTCDDESNIILLPQIGSDGDEAPTKDMNIERDNRIGVYYVQSSCVLSGVNLKITPTGSKTCTD